MPALWNCGRSGEDDLSVLVRRRVVVAARCGIGPGQAHLVRWIVFLDPVIIVVVDRSKAEFRIPRPAERLIWRFHREVRALREEGHAEAEPEGLRLVRLDLID